MPGSAGFACHFSREMIGGETAVETSDGEGVTVGRAASPSANAGHGATTNAPTHADRADRLAKVIMCMCLPFVVRSIQLAAPRARVPKRLLQFVKIRVRLTLSSGYGSSFASIGGRN